MSRAKHILVVDDDALNRELLQEILAGLGYTCETASGGKEALATVSPRFDLVLLDVNMPDMDGFSVARSIRQNEEVSDLPIIMVTALSGKEDRLIAVEAGANDFVAKPIDRTELRVRIASLLRMKEGQDAIKHHKATLQATVEEQTSELRSALIKVTQAEKHAQEAKLDTVRRLAIAAEYRDDNTAAHIYRVGHYCALLGRLLGMDESETNMLYHASLLHDVGKIGVPDSILLKADSFTPEDRAAMEQHTLMGKRILSGSPSDIIRLGELIAYTHHEKWDGTGYPNGLAGETIPLHGRICAVADVFDALTTRRPYKSAFPLDKAVDIMRAGRGTHFDPALLELFLANIDLVVEIQKKYQLESPSLE